jgi:hypothetical protein
LAPKNFGLGALDAVAMDKVDGALKISLGLTAL